MPSPTDSAGFVGSFDATLPQAGTATVSQLDDSIRHVKATTKASFPNVTGAVTPTHTELNYVDGVTSAIQTQLDAKAPLASPTFTGNPTAPTPTAGDNDTSIATTAFVAASFAPLASPALTGTPTAPTAAAGTNTTQVATTAFVRTDGLGGWQLLRTTSTGTGSFVDFIHGISGVVIDSTYDVYMFEFVDVKPDTDSVIFGVRTTTDATNFDTGASDYVFTGTTANYGALTASANPVGNAAGENGVCGFAFMFSPSAAAPCRFMAQLVYLNASGTPVLGTQVGVRNTSANVDGVRFLWSSGTFASGTINMYGRRK